MADEGTLRHRATRLRYDTERELVLSRLDYRIFQVGNDDMYKNKPAVLSTVLAALELASQAEGPSSAPSGHLLPVENGEKGVWGDAAVTLLKGPGPTAYCPMPTAQDSPPGFQRVPTEEPR